MMTDSHLPEPVEATRIDPKLLEMLVCPLTKESLDYDAARQELISRGAKLAYPIRDGIPIMLPEEARPTISDYETRLAGDGVGEIEHALRHFRVKPLDHAAFHGDRASPGVLRQGEGRDDRPRAGHFG